MKRKLYITLLTVLSMTGSLLAGCGNDDGKKDKDSSAENKDICTQIDWTVNDNSPKGAILQCFSWSFETIMENMEDIYNAGYVAIQTSPINECFVGGNGGMELMGQGKWYYHYQPTDWKIGNYQLGTRDEFIKMCDLAHSYGISVIVDVVPNHTTGEKDAVSEEFIKAVGGEDKLYHTNGTKDIANYADRKECTLNALTGLYDVNTENEKFQDYFIAYLNDCIRCGADGFRYDTAKHIGLPMDPLDDGVTQNNFWKRAINEIDNAENIFNYGEVLAGDNAPLNDYINAIGAIVDSAYGEKIQASLRLRRFDIDSFADYRIEGMDKPNVVTWVESHDTYTGGGTKDLTDEDIALGWAIISARENGTPLFFSRPYGSDKDNMWGTMNRIGLAGNFNYKSDLVVAANLFRKAMLGEDEKLYSYIEDSSVLFIERGDKGLVVVNLSKETKDISMKVGLSDGDYLDRAKKLINATVKDGEINFTMEPRSACVFYNEGYKDRGEIPAVKVDDSTNMVYYEDCIDVSLKCSNTDKAEYSIDGKEWVEYKDGDSILIGAKTGEITKLSLKGSNADYNTAMTYEFTHKQSIVEGTKIYFEKPEGWGNKINAYVYDESGTKVIENAFWPGKEMTDEGNGLYSYTFDREWEFGLVIFNDGKNQSPSAMEPGYVIEADMVY